MLRDPDGNPFVPREMPNYDDEDLGFSFFRTGLKDADYSGLTLPRTFFGRSLFESVDFSDSDLVSSRMCWNDFEGCDFSKANLSGCDMRASNFKHCKFVGALLLKADFRQSSFENCDFTDADVTGAQAEDMDGIGRVQDQLTEEQIASMEWLPDSGPEPPGG